MSKSVLKFISASSILALSLLTGAHARYFPSAAQSPSAQLISDLKAARKDAVGQPLTINGQQVCGPNGNTAQPNMKALNNNKNRTDEPASKDYVTVSWDDLKALPADQVAELQGAPVSVVGYLSHKINVEAGSPGESTNCNLLQPDEVDWHMYLTKQPAQQIRNAIIVETTPRVRPNHKWTTAMLAPYVNESKQVRISGWLIYDFQHVNVIGTERVSVWEVHPITRIEVQDDQGNWVNVEQ